MVQLHEGQVPEELLRCSPAFDNAVKLRSQKKVAEQKFHWEINSLIFFAFLVSLPFFFSRNSLKFLSVFRFFPKDFRGSATLEILAFLVVFLAVFQKGKEKTIRERAVS